MSNFLELGFCMVKNTTIVPIFEDYECVICKKITSRWATKLQCNCHNEKGFFVNLGSILHVPQKREKEKVM